MELSARILSRVWETKNLFSVEVEFSPSEVIPFKDHSYIIKGKLLCSIHVIKSIERLKDLDYRREENMEYKYRNSDTLD